jgi:predicted lipoprotein with Yx(FWY)xxD motif
MPRHRALASALLPLALALAACSTSGSATPGLTFGPTLPPASASEAPTTAPSEAPTEAATTTVEATEVGTLGTVLVAGENGMTVYTFTQDVADSGTSACTETCIETWPALTVPAGTTPTGGDGVSGTLATITRADDGTLQVTYNGLPLYFFKNDSAPGDANGVYENWEAVKP